MPSAGQRPLDDLHSFHPVEGWALLSQGSFLPAARLSHGFTSAGGKLYVHGGISISAGVCAREKAAATVALAPTWEVGHTLALGRPPSCDQILGTACPTGIAGHMPFS